MYLFSLVLITKNCCGNYCWFFLLLLLQCLPWLCSACIRMFHFVGTLVLNPVTNRIPFWSHHGVFVRPVCVLHDVVPYSLSMCFLNFHHHYRHHHLFVYVFFNFVAQRQNKERKKKQKKTRSINKTHIKREKQSCVSVARTHTWTLNISNVHICVVCN